MARRRRFFRLNLRKGAATSVLSILLVLTGILLFLSFFARSTVGSFIVDDYVSRLFGWGSILVPFLLVILGLLFFSHRPKFVNFNLFLGLIFFTVAFIGLSHLLFFRGPDSTDLARLGQGGGLFGDALSRILRRAFLPPGAFLILLSLAVVAVVILFNTSVDNLLSFFMRLLSPLGLWLSSFFNKEKSPTRAPLKKDSAVPEEIKEAAPVALPLTVVPLPSEPFEEAATRKVVKGSGESSDGYEEKRPTSSREETLSMVWEYPPLSLISDAKVVEANRGDVAKNAATIEKTLESFGIKARVVEVNLGPAVTQYALESAQGTKIARIKNLQNDLALALASPTGTVRIEAPIPGKSLVGIEVPNLAPSLVTLKSLMLSEEMKSGKSKLLVSLGLDVAGDPVTADLKKMPHLLIAGSTGSGKSTLIHAFLATLLFRCSPEELRLILVDTKRVELTEYNEIGHLLTPVITESEKVLAALKWTLGEMERRYKLFQNAKVRDIDNYNELSGFQALPYIIVLVDELADMMQLAPVEVEKAVCRLAQMARATGIHLVLATQRPSVDVLTGLIKANIPCRIAFNVTSQVDSRVIIDQTGAEKLLGRGDMLYLPADSSKPIRIQGVYVHPNELRDLLNFIRTHSLGPAYKEEVTEPVAVRSGNLTSTDELFPEAVKIICEYDRASASLLQRRLKIGYARAARLLDEMEGQGIVGRADGSKPREVLIHDPLVALGSND